MRSEIAKKTSNEGPKTLEITFLDFLHDSVVPLLKYLDTKREKYIVRREYGSYVELIQNKTKLKRAIVVKREWDSATAMAKERAASFTAECVAAKAALREREDQLGEKEIECKVLQLKHEEELTEWAKKLADCESARSLKVECKLKIKLKRRQL